MYVGSIFNQLMESLERKAIEQFREEGYGDKEIILQPHAFMRYNGQLEDIKVNLPLSRINSPQDVDLWIQAFENEYTALYTEVAKYPEAGILCMAVGLTGIVQKVKPKLVKHPLADPEPKKQALKGTRSCYFENQFYDTAIYDFAEILAGNVIHGPAVLEHVDTNYVIPPGWWVEIDEYRTLWLKREVK